MKRKKKPTVVLEFPGKGYRPNPEYGLRYRSKCGNYVLAKQDRVGGIEMKRHSKHLRWLAIFQRDGFQEIISKHEYRETAIASCQKHAAKQLAMGTK